MIVEEVCLVVDVEVKCVVLFCDGIELLMSVLCGYDVVIVDKVVMIVILLQFVVLFVVVDVLDCSQVEQVKIVYEGVVVCLYVFLMLIVGVIVVGIVVVLGCVFGLYCVILVLFLKMLGYFSVILQGNLIECIIVSSKDEMGVFM